MGMSMGANASGGNILIQGAGCPYVNGVYERDGVYSGRPHYHHRASPTGTGTGAGEQLQIWWDNDDREWRIGRTLDYYYISKSYNLETAVWQLPRVHRNRNARHPAPVTRGAGAFNPAMGGMAPSGMVQPSMMQPAINAFNQQPMQWQQQQQMQHQRLQQQHQMLMQQHNMHQLRVAVATVPESVATAPAAMAAAAANHDAGPEPQPVVDDASGAWGALADGDADGAVWECSPVCRWRQCRQRPGSTGQSSSSAMGMFDFDCDGHVCDSRNGEAKLSGWGVGWEIYHGRAAASHTTGTCSPSLEKMTAREEAVRRRDVRLHPPTPPSRSY